MDTHSAHENPDLARALERTVPSTEFTPEAVRRELASTPVAHPAQQTAGQFLARTHTDSSVTDSPDALATAPLTSFHDSQTALPDFGGESAVEGERRYQVSGEIGRGATSRVYAVRDQSLGRTIAVKLLRRTRERKTAARERFLHEARVTAMLEHPGIMPVHDIGRNENGEFYFTMKNIAGVSLGAAIRTAREGGTVPEEFNGIDGRVLAILKVCDALAFAHSRGVVHQDIKPDNIMLGEHGEVLLLDWGSALAGEERGAAEGKALFGTPAYMSPEQARRERADERSDIYCLGATFFHALLLRHPVWSDDPDAFWEKKRTGQLDPILPVERRAVPAALVDICLRAMHADPAQRYQSADEFSDEIKRWMAGQAVLAHRESPFEAFMRWYRRNKRLFFVSSSAAVLIFGAAGLLFREKLRELVTWRLLYEEQFEMPTDSLARSWRSLYTVNWTDMLVDSGFASGTWRVIDGRLRGRAMFLMSNIAFTRPVAGDIRVDWDVTPLARPDNLNCFIGGATRFDGYCFHVGGFGLKNTVTLTRGRATTVMERASLPLELTAGQTYRMRMEKEGKSVRLFINGRRVIDFRDADAAVGPGHQGFGFEVNTGNVIAIDNISVYHHPLPLKVSPLATPDDHREQGNIARARVLYEEIARTYEGTPVAAEALFKYARCQHESDSTLMAIGTFRAFETRYPRHELVPLSMYERARIYRERGDTAAMMQVYDELATRFRGHPVLASALRELSTPARALLDSIKLVIGMSSDAPRMLDALHEQRKTVQHWARRMGQDVSGDSYLNALLSMLLDDFVGMHIDSAYRLIPDNRREIALWASGNQMPGWVVQHGAEFPDALSNAMHTVGAWDEILRRMPSDRARCAEALFHLGRYEEAMARSPQDRALVAQCLVRMGRYEEVVRDFAEQPAARVQALFRLGRYGECMNEYSADTLYAFRSAAILSAVPRLLELLDANADATVTVYNNVLRWYPEVIRLYREHGHDYTISGEFHYTGAFIEIGRPEGVFDVGRRPAAVLPAFISMGLTDSALTVFRGNLNMTGQIHLDRGEFDEIERVGIFSTREIDMFRRQGRIDEFRSRFPFHRTAAASMLLDYGQFEIVLRDYRDQRKQCAAALVALGRFEEVLTGYPDHWKECNDALLGMGRIGEAREKFAEFRHSHAAALVRAGRVADVVREYADCRLEWEIAAIHQRLAAPQRVSPLYRTLISDAFETRGYEALARWTRADRRGANSLFLSRGVFQYSAPWWHLRFERFLLPAILRAIDGRPGELDSTCARVMSDHRYHFSQQLWHEAAWLSGVIGDSAFLAQPYRLGAGDRLNLLKAIRADIDGRREEARGLYASCADLPRYPRSVHPWDWFESWTVREFIRWRSEK